MKYQEWLRKFQLLLIVACGSYPLVMVILDWLSPGMLPWGWAFSAMYVVCSLAGMGIRGRWRLCAGSLMSAGMMACAFLLSPEENRLGALTGAALCGGLLLWSLKLGGWSSRREIPVLWVILGGVAHLLGQLRIYMDKVAGGMGLAVYSGGIFAALVGFALLTMLSLNRGSLTAASGKRQSVPGTMRQKNGLMTAALVVLAVAAAFLPSAFSGLVSLLRQGIGWFVWLVSRLIPKSADQTVGSIPVGSDSGTPPVGGEESTLVLNPLVEKLMAVCGAVLFFALLILLLYRLYRMLEGWLQRLLNTLGKYASSVAEDYVDEVTDTREEGTAEKLEKNPFAARLSFLEPKNKSPGERIRLRYQRLMRKHPEWDPGSTARETLPDSMASLYEQARYSDHPVSESDAAAFADGSKQI